MGNIEFLEDAHGDVTRLEAFRGERRDAIAFRGKELNDELSNSSDIKRLLFAKKMSILEDIEKENETKF